MSVRLNRTEIKSLCKVINNFDQIDTFEIKQERSGGIGTSTCVRISSSTEDEFPITTEIDITDYGKW